MARLANPSGKRAGVRLPEQNLGVRLPLRKDRHERQQALDKLIKRLGKATSPGDLLRNYGYRKYLRLQGKTHPGMDQGLLLQPPGEVSTAI